MFEYFPGNYVWSLGVVATLNSGGLIDEVDRACRPIKEAALAGADAGTPDFLRAWTSLTDQLVGRAEEAESAGHERTAGQLYARATNYLCQAERMLSSSDPNRVPTYRRVLELQQKAFELRDQGRVTRVTIPYEGSSLPAYFSQAPAARDGAAPVIVLVNGLDSTKEHQYSSGHWEELAARGISCLMLDQPGTGEALRLQNLRLASTPRRGRKQRSTGSNSARTSTRTASELSAGRWAGTSRRGPQRSRSDSRWSWRGEPITTGARCSGPGSSARANVRCRITGNTCCGCGGTPTSTSSSSSPMASTSTAWSTRSTSRS